LRKPEPYDDTGIEGALVVFVLPRKGPLDTGSQRLDRHGALHGKSLTDALVSREIPQPSHR
jgi:hypothetical protein